MENLYDNEVVLVGNVMPGIQHITYNRKNACLLKIKIDNKYLSNTIPIIFLNPDESELRKLKNKEIAIIGHVEAKWSIRIIVDAYKTDGEVIMKIQKNFNH